jgi:hydroxypyruvate isomerase
MPKFAANLTTMFTELSFLDRFAAARAHRFDAVEFLFPYAFAPGDIADRLAASGLQLVQHNLPPGDWAAGDRGMACDPARTGEFQDSVGLALAYASALGVRQLHCLAGNLPPGVSADQARQTYLANLKFAAAELDARGMRLLIEPINTNDMPGYFLTGSAQAAAVIRECGAPNLFLQYDIYHMQRMEGDLAATIRRHIGLIGHVQLADVPGRHEPGTGELNYANIFRALRDAGYQGTVGFELAPTGRSEDAVAICLSLANGR